MSCCDETTARVPGLEVSRRSMFKSAALIASVIPSARPGSAGAQQKEIKLAYCSQLLCGVPYEVARSAGHFKKHGLEVELVYTRGVNAMDLEDAKQYLGGSFEFMGVAVRADEIAKRRPEMVALAKALADSLNGLRQMSGDQMAASLPKEMTTGLDLKELGDILQRHRV